MVTLVCRPRRFGKTLNLDTMRALQGTVPVAMLSFANVKAPDFEGMARGIREIVASAFDVHDHLRAWDGLTQNRRRHREAHRRAGGLSVLRGKCINWR